MRQQELALAPAAGKVEIECALVGYYRLRIIAPGCGVYRSARSGGIGPAIPGEHVREMRWRWSDRIAGQTVASPHSHATERLYIGVNDGGV